MTGEGKKLADLLRYIARPERKVLMPLDWVRLYSMLPDSGSSGERKPGLPLILGAADAPQEQKHARLVEHVEYAARTGVLDAVDDYVRRLEPEQWQPAWARKHAPWDNGGS